MLVYVKFIIVTTVLMEHVRMCEDSFHVQLHAKESVGYCRTEISGRGARIFAWGDQLFIRSARADCRLHIFKWGGGHPINIGSRLGYGPLPRRFAT